MPTALLAAGSLDEETGAYLQYASLAVKRGVAHARLVPFAPDGSVLLEIFTPVASAPWWWKTRGRSAPRHPGRRRRHPQPDRTRWKPTARWCRARAT